MFSSTVHSFKAFAAERTIRELKNCSLRLKHCIKDSEKIRPNKQQTIQTLARLQNMASLPLKLKIKNIARE